MIIGIVFIIIALAFDQITKQLAYIFLYQEPTSKLVVLIPEVLEVTFAKNTAAAYGMFEGQTWLFYIVTVIALGMFGYLYKDVNFKTKKIYSISIVLFIAGTLGNFIDRIFLGYVIDFMRFPFLVYIVGDLGRFTNNWADMFLSAAIVLFAIDLFFFESKRLKKEKIEHEAHQD
ncbi:MAG: signal peptidase II [Bacillota bacterium]|nr:MAG: signal peptidase II [Bacillota bacterium]